METSYYSRRRRRQRSLARQSINVDTTSSGTKRRTRSAAKMDVDSVETTNNSSVDNEQQQQQQSGVEDRASIEDATETETTSSEDDQSPTSAAIEQSHRDGDNGTVAATTSDSTVKNDDEDDDNNNDDDDYVIDVSPVENNPETAWPTDSTSDDKEGLTTEAPMSSEESPVEVSSDKRIKVTDVMEDGKEDLRDTPMPVESECDQLAVTSECATEVNRKSSATEERAPAETDVESVETTDNSLQYLCLNQQQQQLQQLASDAGRQTENAAETVTTCEYESSTEEEKRKTQDNEENDIDDKDNDRVVHKRNSEEDLDTEMPPAPQRQLDTVEDFTKLQTESDDHPVEALMETDVPDSKKGVSISTPVKAEPNSDDEQASISPPLSNPARPPLLPLTSALLFPGDGPPVPVIRVTCGDCRAEFHVDRLVDGLAAVSNSIGTSRTSLCVRTVDDNENGRSGVWMTPNQFQRASGRGTARDWKRSIKHHGVSLKSLMSKSLLSFDATSPGCRCNLCTVSFIATEILVSLLTAGIVVNIILPHSPLVPRPTLLAAC